jgi:hypothetical protein
MTRTRQVVLGICVAAMTLCAWYDPLSSAANRQVDAGLQRALTTFATARALNAIISVVEGTEIAAQPAGVGLTFTPGQVLRPINDVVQQFAHLMLVASIAFGIEKILISIGAHWLMSLALTVAAIAWGYCVLYRSSYPAWLTRILVVLLMTRFAMPAVILSSDVLFQQFMSEEYTSSQSVIDGTTAKLVELQPATAAVPEDKGLLDTMKNWFPKPTGVKTLLAQLKQNAEQAAERMVKLMVIFVLQTMLLPIFLLWALWGVARGAFEPKLSRRPIS